jgi:hypothetical protein
MTLLFYKPIANASPLPCCPASQLSAEAIPRPGPHDNRVRIGHLDRGAGLPRRHVSLTHVTTIEFGEGESIRSIIAGDTEGFEIDGVPGGQAFAIKPVARGVAYQCDGLYEPPLLLFPRRRGAETPASTSCSSAIPRRRAARPGPSRPMRRTANYAVSAADRVHANRHLG